MNMLHKLIIVLLLIFPIHSLANECNEKQAMDIAVSAVKEKFSSLSSNPKDYKIYSDITNKDNWIVSIPTPPSSLGNTTRGGGLPEVTISKANCEVLSVYLSR